MFVLHGPTPDMATATLPHPLLTPTIERRTFKQRVRARDSTEARAPKEAAPLDVHGAEGGYLRAHGYGSHSTRVRDRASGRRRGS
jgi:hypothetical protein